jgi:hypothetical protein
MFRFIQFVNVNFNFMTTTTKKPKNTGDVVVVQDERREATRRTIIKRMETRVREWPIYREDSPSALNTGFVSWLAIKS